MKENYKPLLTLWFPSWSKNFELFEEIFEIFAFVRFMDFFHSVKKVSKQTIFCEIMCVSKRALVILIRMLYCTAFFKAKNFVILFFLSFVWFISGEGISLGPIFPGGNYLGGKFLGDNFHRGSFHRGNIHRGYFYRRQFSGGQFSGRGNFLGGRAQEGQPSRPLRRANLSKDLYTANI